ncbi:MAG: major capsid protein [Alsobacter sp.]
MSPFDVFKSDLFSATSLSAAVDKISYTPGFLGGLGIFSPTPVRTTDVWIEERDFTPSLVPITPRGGAPTQVGGDARKGRNFRTRRIGAASTIMADELQNIRQFGSETDLKSLSDELARRQFKLITDLELTMEFFRMGAVQGVFADPSGGNVYDWSTEFSQAPGSDSAIDFTAYTAGEWREKCAGIKRAIVRGLKGRQAGQIVALCGDAFWDAMVKCQEVRDSYLGTPFADALRGDSAWNYGGVEWFDFGGIRWTNYRGTDDNSTVAVGDEKAYLFPTGAGIFQQIMGPGESFDQVNQLGQQWLSNMILDNDRNRYVSLEVYSYPLFVCLMPGALYTLQLD